MSSSVTFLFIFKLSARAWLTLLQNNTRKKETQVLGMKWWIIIRERKKTKSHIWRAFHRLKFCTVKETKRSITVTSDARSQQKVRLRLDLSKKKFVSTHYSPDCNKALQSFFWSWLLLCTPHGLLVKSFKGSDAAALALSVVRTTAAHYQCVKNYFQLLHSRFNTHTFWYPARAAPLWLTWFPFCLFPETPAHGDREIVVLSLLPL